jgi:hypothetical protein
MSADRLIFIPEKYCKHKEILVRDDEGRDGVVLKMSELPEAIRSGRIHGNVILNHEVKEVM